MKRLPVSASIGILMIACMLSTYAAPFLKDDARHVIRRSAKVVVAAQKAARLGHHYAGLGKAVAHQKHARRLFARGFYLEAIHHSLRARALAVKVIRRNHGGIAREAFLDKIERRYANQSPSELDLDTKLNGEDIDSDEISVNIHIDFDID